MEEILHQAEQSEKRYDWLAATESYQKALNLLSEDDFSHKANTTERFAHAVYRSAFQAENNDEFRERMRRAGVAYKKAVEFYGKLKDPAKTARTQRCNAMIAYAGYWLAVEAPEKKRLLGESWQLTKDSLKTLKESKLGKEYGETFNQLSANALLWYCYELDYEARKKIIGEVADHGEAAIRLLSTLDEPDERAKAYAKTAFAHSLFAFYFVELDKKEDYSRKAQSYWTKAKEASEASASLEMLCPVPCAHDLLWGAGTQEAVENVQKALENGRRTKDRFIIGSALDWLVYHTAYAGESIDDSDEVVKVYRTIIKYAEDAKRQYSVISFISPRSDAAWTEAVHLYIMPGYRTESDLGKRRAMLETALAAGREALERAESSGYPYVMKSVEYRLSQRRRMLAETEPGLEEKRKLLEEALEHGNESSRISEQLDPLSYWELAVHRGDLAAVKVELADLASDSEIKRSMLQAALLERENATKLMLKDLGHQPQSKIQSFAYLGNAQYFTGDWWARLNRLTCDKEHLRKATEAFGDAVESFQKLNLVSRVAECYWKAAQTYDALGDHLEAAENFNLASESYRSAAEKIPQLKTFYQDHTVYMQAWTEIEKARHHHERQEYGLAKEHFERAAELHKLLGKWSYLEPNYSAWAQVENAEELSRKEQSEEAIKAFKDAGALFKETKDLLQTQLGKIEETDERQMATSMIKASDIRQEYCEARIALEEAKILDKKGNHSSSSEKYGSAVETFEKISQTLESEQEQKEFKLIIALSRAWQEMTLAETEASPALYAEASELFENAKEFSPNEKTKMLVLGNSRFCRALGAGTRFIDTRNTDDYTDAMKYLETASNYYMKAGFPKVSEYSEATKLLFDAYLHMDSAAKETDPEKKAKLYTMAEKVLQSSAGSFMKAEHPEKREQVLGLLEKTKKDRELALSLAEVLHAPLIASTTSAFATPTPTREEAVGSERFEHADIQANLIIGQKELKVGEPLNVEIELVNAGKGSAVLIKINEVIPGGFELSEKPEAFRVQDSYIDMKGKRLGPLKTEELRLVLRPKVQGTFAVKPTILYLDENGKYRSHKLEAATIIVKELGIKGWLKGER